MIQKTENTKLYRIIDANFNRTLEGIRVIEDIIRFYLDNKNISGQLKNMRHTVRKEIENNNIDLIDIINSRDTEADVGRNIEEKSEYSRKNIIDIVYANCRRATESLRVLEEIFKIDFLNKDMQNNSVYEDLRYKFYTIEKNIIMELSKNEK